MSHSTAARPDFFLFPRMPKRGAGILIAAAAFSAGLLGMTPFVGVAAASADDATPGIFTISASATSIAPGDHAFISVHRSSGADGVVAVSVDSAALPAELAAVIAPIDAEVTFLDGDTADKSIPIVFLGDDRPGDLPGDDLPGGDLPGDDHPSDDDHEGDDVIDDTGDDDGGAGIDTPGIGGGTAHVGTSVVASGAVSRVIAAEGGSAPFTVSLSAPTGGAGLGTPSSVSISVATPPTTTPVDGGSGASGSTTGGTTTPGTTARNSAGTTSPVGGGQSLADTGVDAILPFIVATLAAIAGLAALLVVRRRRTASTE